MRRTGLVQRKQEGDAMLSWQVGAAKITCVVEMVIPFPYDPQGFFLRDATPEALKASPWLYPHFANEDGSLNVSVHALLVEAPGLRLMVDTCIGNDKPRHLIGGNPLATPFLQHLGIPVLNLEFSGEDNSGDYHSIYDSYDNFIRFIDPGFYYGATLSKMAGHVSLRMLNADRLPFDFRILYKEVKSYSSDLQTMISNLRETTSVNNEIIRKKYFVLAADSAKKFIPQTSKQEVPFIDFSPLENAITSLGKAADHAFEIMSNKEMNTKETDSLNRLLYRAEQELLLEKGLPLRPWYKHVLYAPGFYTGYSVKTLPGIRESIEQRNFYQAESEIRRAAFSINKLAGYLQQL